MSNSNEGLQFPILPETQKSSSSQVGKEIIAEALSLVDHQCSQNALNEKNWRKNYPTYFKALVENGIKTVNNPITIATQGLHKAHHNFDFFRNGQRYSLKDVIEVPITEKIQTITFKGTSEDQPEWYVPYRGQNLKGEALIQQIQTWQDSGIIEVSHAQALREVNAHPEWFDLSDRTMVLFGAASEAGPLTWLSRWKANIIAVDLPSERVWEKILTTIQCGNATLYAPSFTHIINHESLDELKTKLGVNLLTQIPEIIQWLTENPHRLDLASIAYLDGEKHVRVSMAMDSIMSHISKKKPDSSLMYMCTPTDVYAVPKEVINGAINKYNLRSKFETILSKSIATLSMNQFFKHTNQQLIQSDNGKSYGITDCLVIEQGPNYALAKRIQQWRATLARYQGQLVSINIAPSTTTYSVTKNPLLKAAFNGADLFDVEAFSPETTNAIMAALWVHDLRNPRSFANPETAMDHPLELMMDGANHGGLWRVSYLARTALPFAAIYGFATDKLPIKNTLAKLKKNF